MILDKVPLEILLSILDNIDVKSDLAACCGVKKLWRDSVLPKLYRYIWIDKPLSSGKLLESLEKHGR